MASGKWQQPETPLTAEAAAASMAEAAAVGWRRHRQWQRRKRVNNDGNDRQQDYYNVGGHRVDVIDGDWFDDNNHDDDGYDDNNHDNDR